MRFFFLSLFALQFSVTVFSQTFNKPCIDSAAVVEWVNFGNTRKISNDGRYFMYSLFKQHKSELTLVIRSTETEWEEKIAGVGEGTFSGNNKQAVYLLKDSLCFLNLETKEVKIIPNVTRLSQPEDQNGEWIAYQTGDTSKRLTVLNLLSGNELNFSHVSEFSFDAHGKALLLTTLIGQSGLTELKWINLVKGLSKTIWSTQDNKTHINGHKFDDSSDQLVFLTKEPVPEGFGNVIWYYKEGTDKAIVKATNKSNGIDKGFQLSSQTPNFSKDGRYIYFQIEYSSLPQVKENAVSVDIWSYRDTVLQPTQLSSFRSSSFAAVIGLDEDRVVRLTHDFESISAFPVKGDHVVLSYNDEGDRFWLKQNNKNYLVSLKDGSRQLLKTVNAKMDFWFSPDGNYLLYFDNRIRGDYYSYNLTAKKEVNISSAIKTSLNWVDEFFPDTRINTPVGLAGWVENTDILVYDNYDIWKVDLAGVRQPVNITKGYGASSKIKLRLFGVYGPFSHAPIYRANDSVLVMAFDTKNKHNGFYQINLDIPDNPTSLIMGPWAFCHQGPGGFMPLAALQFNSGMVPIKAENASKWVIMRQTATEAPNYFLTSDFKNFKPITDYQPQRGFNWMTAELVSWKQFDGKVTQGVLYKPENFDSSKKYPVLINYYEQLSHRVYEYPTPAFSRSAHINIPWFVSRGYLVLTPDIFISKGGRGSGTYNSIESGAKWLAKINYVDAKRIGIAGHSSGGFETNYLVTHSNTFAAAIEGAGVSNAISSSLQLTGIDGKARGSRLASSEVSMGSTIWEKPQCYIENTPVLRANLVITPMLILHCKEDGAVPWEQAIEMFISLRRLNKKVWMLQYDGHGHGVSGDAAIDFTNRMTQFFDYYFKKCKASCMDVTGCPCKVEKSRNGLAVGYVR